MRNLIIPTIPPTHIYAVTKERARSKVKKDRLENLENYVLKRYEEYKEKRTELEKITDSTILIEEDKEALLSCYTRNKKGYFEGDVVNSIIQSQSIQHRQNCPYCGLDKPRTIDHYLPKDDFPEFSIYPLNLIPCCSYCNQKKSTTWKEDGKRTFINLYFDKVPESEQFLFLNLEYKDSDLAPYISFEIKNPDNIETDLYELIKGHYSTLDLLREFSEKIEEEISNIIDKVTHYPKITMYQHQEDFERLQRTYTRKYGLNHWQTVLYQNLVSNDAFFIETMQRTS